MQYATNKSVSLQTHHPMPFVRMELVVLSIQDGVLRALLGKRAEAPYAGRWGLPGGVLRIDLDADLEAAAIRVGEERLNHRFAHVQQVLAVGGAKRDPRAPWAMSVIYVTIVPPELDTAPGKRVEALKWHAVQDIGELRVAFDHVALVEAALAKLRRQVRALQYVPGWLPAELTIPELHAWSEAILAEKLDKVTFRRRVLALSVLKPVAGAMRLEGAHRPAQVYRLA